TILLGKCVSPCKKPARGSRPEHTFCSPARRSSMGPSSRGTSMTVAARSSPVVTRAVDPVLGFLGGGGQKPPGRRLRPRAPARYRECDEPVYAPAVGDLGGAPLG